MSDIRENLILIVREMKKRPLMYLSHFDMHSVGNFFNGYFTAVHQFDESFGNGFENWLEKKINIKSASSWKMTIFYYIANEDEAKTPYVMLECLEEYARDI